MQSQDHVTPSLPVFTNREPRSEKEKAQEYESKLSTNINEMVADLDKKYPDVAIRECCEARAHPFLCDDKRVAVAHAKYAARSVQGMINEGSITSAKSESERLATFLTVNAITLK